MSLRCNNFFIKQNIIRTNLERFEITRLKYKNDYEILSNKHSWCFSTCNYHLIKSPDLLVGGTHLEVELYSLMILPNGLSPRCEMTVEIPNLYLSLLRSLDISLRYKLLSHRFRYKTDTKILAYQDWNISTHACKKALE